MKKTITLLLAIMMTLSLAACGSQSASASQPAPTSAQPVAEATPEVTVQPENTAGQPDQNTDGRKILIVYFSPANSDTADAVSSATPRAGEQSSVAYVAQLVGEQVDADMAQIVAAEAYPLPYNDTVDRARKEQNDNARPAFTLDVNPEEYDVIFFGYPIWWYHLPMIVRNFFESYDFSGKTIAPFVLHAGSRDGGTFGEIRELEPNATVLDGLAVAGERAGSAQQAVSDWLAGLSY